MRLAHIVNPFRASEASELVWAQPITYQTMRTARDFAAGEAEVALFSAQYPEDRAVLPEGLTATPDLDRSVLDVGQFKSRRKFPLLTDILDRLYDATKADWLVYTNVDIALMPHFYLAVKRLIESGRDALVINRRILSTEYRRVEQIPLMYSLIGTAHEGYDCFVFRRDVYRKFRLGLVCIGVPWVGRALLWNLFRHSQHFEELKDHHLTFHLGVTDWGSAARSEYAVHNGGELRKVLRQLQDEGASLEKGTPFSRYLADIWPLLGLEQYRPTPWRRIARWVRRRTWAVWRALNGRCWCGASR